MIRSFTILLLAFCYVSTQALALDCSIACTMHELENVQNHCHEEQNVETSCFGEINGMCFHESLSLKEELLSKSGVFHIENLVSIQEDQILALIQGPGIAQRYKPKILEEKFLDHKSRLVLYILKDQFLI